MTHSSMSEEYKTLDLFTIQSNINRQKILTRFVKNTDFYIDSILLCNNLTKADFTKKDWNIISQYMEE